MDGDAPRIPTAAPAPELERPTRAEAEAAVETLIRWAGDEPGRDGLRDTPARVVRAYEEIFGGYRQDPAQLLGRTFLEESGYDDLVLVRDIAFVSHCEHHLAPIVGKAHVAYNPSGRILGLSKIARLVELFARRLPTQETMTRQIAAAIDEALAPSGVAVVLEAEHLCMSMRGVRAHGSMTVTSSFLGTFKDDRAERDRVLSLAIRP